MRARFLLSTLLLASLVSHCGTRSGLESPPLLALALGGAHSCAVLDDATVRCWGRNEHGELGDGTAELRSRPTPVLGLTEVQQVAVGQRHACALRRDGRVLCWGGNDAGMLGDGTMRERRTAGLVVGLSEVTRIAAGPNDASCAVLREGTVRCWGNDAWRAPRELDDAGHELVSAGPEHDVCLFPPVRPDAGPTGFECRQTPRAIAQLDDAVDVALGEDQACALRRDGTVRCWGSFDRSTGPTLEPAAVPMPRLRDIVQLAMYELSGCALDRVGAVWCWGNLGNNLRSSEGPLPVRLAALEGSRALTVSLLGACVLGRDGGARCSPPAPFTFASVQELPSLAGARTLGAGALHLCGWFGGEDVRCLGYNQYGQLGAGTTSAPVRDALSVQW